MFKTPNFRFLCVLCDCLSCVYMYYILRFLQHACSVINFVILTIVCRAKSASELMLHCYVYSTLNKSSMSNVYACIYRKVFKNIMPSYLSIAWNIRLNRQSLELEETADFIEVRCL